MRKSLRVWKDVYAIGEPDISYPSDCCIYMIDAGGELVLIGSGAGESFSQLIDNISTLGCDTQQLKATIVTHPILTILALWPISRRIIMSS